MSLLDLLKPAPKLSHTARILKVLKTEGQATNHQLNKICFRYGARIHELRAEGHDILSVKEKDGLWRFVYKGHKDDQENAA
ncbi:hypothetical protein QFZ60_001548 [Arthrobacter sp. B2I5]|uniref:helix-turn-helix domain-containing protein n=1 Tax=Arthrobacter sp. B2I5 TaxID=3042266 RepID=UPI002786F629|nr:helix-turn-helix domain-containing protein [Arthrobacter sp. B2I5]MDQ0825375.1 hypothetical protein [Arthrobacter sp. B2I5]